MSDLKEYLVDMHTHTVASGHAYNTINEMAHAAAQAGLEILGITEHSMTMPGTCHEFYFQNLKNACRNVEGVELCLGVELNIIDYNGKIDLSEHLLREMDVVVASIHNNIGYESGSTKENTNAIIGAIKNPLVNIIGHPDDSRISLDYEEIVLASKEFGTLLEINNSSLTPGSFRVEPEKNDLKILELCKKYHVPIIIGSDAHSIDKVANHEFAMILIEQIDFPDELILNYNPERLKPYINKYK